ncbi:hypothetical protein AVEN_124814-1, partial [Araneus ventricosus]
SAALFHRFPVPHGRECGRGEGLPVHLGQAVPEDQGGDGGRQRGRQLREGQLLQDQRNRDTGQSPLRDGEDLLFVAYTTSPRLTPTKYQF